MPGRAPSLAVLRAADRAAVPWKNGGGVTREVAVSPPGSPLGDFDWRVSIAEIGVAGPFSLFPGIDRRMAVLSGRLSLRIDGQAAVTLSNDGSAVAFPGEVPVFAEPLGATVTDLNVMTRRGRCSATLTRRTTGESAVLELRGATTLLIALTELKVRSGPLEAELAPLDALALGDGTARVLPQGAGPASFEVVEIFR
ncbi:MAG: HutD family protein [Steroidobacteraceae bacterium]